MIHFVGAGPGAEDLITVRGMRLLEQADVIIYAGSLVNPKLLDYATADCKIYNSAVMTLEEVIAVMREAEAEGQNTVRLHTGEPSIYGAVREQMEMLDEEGIPYDSCPGVSACFGAAASLNLEYTLPGISQSLVITRMEGKTAVPEKEQIELFASHRCSMAVYLSAGMIEELAKRLILGGYDENTPAALVYKATWPDEQCFVCTLKDLPDLAKAHRITKTALILVGDVIAKNGYERSKLYDPTFETEFRKVKKKTIRASLSIISFTKNGMELSKRFQNGPCDEVVLYTKWKAKEEKKVNNENEETETEVVQYVEESLADWTEKQFAKRNAILFIGACGIAVRAISSCVKDKFKDSPVLVLDEKGQFMIPILSGHIGGANAIAKDLAAYCNAIPVLTTATDVQEQFAIDLFAKENGLRIMNREKLALVTNKVLQHETIKIYVEPGISLSLLDEKGIVISEADREDVDVRIGIDPPKNDCLYLRPKQYVVGLGCKKGKNMEALREFLEEICDSLGIDTEEIAGFASIDVKKDEAGIKELAYYYRVPFWTFSKEELSQIVGTFSASSFVWDTVGVDNVCERSAMAVVSNGELIKPKTAKDGMTIAIVKQIRK